MPVVCSITTNSVRISELATLDHALLQPLLGQHRHVPSEQDSRVELRWAEPP